MNKQIYLELTQTVKEEIEQTLTAQKMKFSIKNFFSKCDQIRSFLMIWSHLLKKSLMENFIFCVVSELEINIQEVKKDSQKTLDNKIENGFF